MIVIYIITRLMENKQTAVEWAFAMLGKMSDEKIKLKAKQMEKEQIINAIDAGHRSTYSICEEGCAANMFGLRMDESAEQYYKETYGK